MNAITPRGDVIGNNGVMPAANGKQAAPTLSVDTLFVDTLFVDTLGNFALRVGERPVALATRKAAALLAALALSDDGTESRERLVGLLWSDTAEEKARTSLRQALYLVRDALQKAGFHGFAADKLTAQLARGGVQVDVSEVLAAAKAGRAHPLLLERTRLTDALLRDFEGVDEAFRAWLIARRGALHDRLVRLLEAAMRDRAAPAAQREELASALLNLDPTHEEAARLRIAARAADGDIGGALRLYKELWDLLAREYDVEPSEETQALIAALRMEQGSAEPAKLPAAAPQRLPATGRALMAPARAAMKPVVAIYPFDSSVGRAHHGTLVEGFRRELIACLVQFREWYVREARDGDAPEPADDYQIEAAALGSAEAARLVLTLRDPRTNRYLWSERVHMSTATSLNAQQMIVRLVGALNVHFSTERMGHLTRPSGLGMRISRSRAPATMRLACNPEWHGRTTLP